MQRVLIANRGEIARRVIRTCHQLGLRTVAVFSDADRGMPFVGEADLAVHIGPSEAASSYLDGQRILEAAARACADAVHPGYGFLAENADFAEAVAASGFTWVGPPAAAMRAMADKGAARRIAEAQGVPIVPGYDGPTDIVALTAAAAEIGYPVLIKALAGGGGRGLRRVDAPEQLADSLASAQREASAAFGDERVLLERYVQRPRHVEVQIMADAHDTVLHLGERECSVQRRHQKILEEAPSPGVDPELRARLGDAACTMARAAGYVGAGTVEFLLDADGSFYFLEMNTRLQVEHPVTEQVTSLDLVELQLRVARGEPLGLSQADVRIVGWAIEARLYAEDPLRDWLPATGQLHRVHLPADAGVRIDSGVEHGSTLSPWYDSMIAKVIATGDDRVTANDRLARALRGAWVPGVVSNLPLLRQIVAHPLWRDADLDTHFLQRAGLPRPPPANAAWGALAATVHGFVHRGAGRGAVPAAWRVHGRAVQLDRWLAGRTELTASWQPTPEGLRIEVTVDDAPPTVYDVRIGALAGDTLSLEVDGVHRVWHILRVGDQVYAHFGDGESFVQAVPRFPTPGRADVELGTCRAPTPGTVAAVHVVVGDSVEVGQRLVTIEAMKMEHAIDAPTEGTIAAIHVSVGDAIDKDMLLVQLADPG